MTAQSPQQSPLVGILGGMGPSATVDFYSKLIEATPASSDQEHVRVMIWSDPTVPDRSLAIMGEGEDPTPKLIAGAQSLADAGAAFYAVACNGAHAFLPRVRQAVDLDYISIIEVTADHVSQMAGVTRAGLLATDATLHSALYQSALSNTGVEVVVPADSDQRAVMDAIYAVKGGRLRDEQRDTVIAVAERLAAEGADVIVAACTEIPLVLTGDESPKPLIDPARLLAARVVSEASQQAG